MRTAEPVTVTEIGFFSVKVKRPIRPDGYADDTIVNFHSSVNPSYFKL